MSIPPQYTVHYRVMCISGKDFIVLWIRTMNTQHNMLWTLLIGLVLLVAVGYFVSGISVSRAESNGKERLKILEQTSDSLSIGLLRTLNPSVKAVQGRLIWVASTQTGMLHIQKLPKPSASEFYELWVYDSRSTTGLPISLGRLTAEEWQPENYWPLKAPSRVIEPYKFVLTQEQERDIIPEQILLMAQP